MASSNTVKDKILWDTRKINEVESTVVTHA